MARSCCFYCPENMAYQCDLDFDHDGMPPCAKADVENVNSAQQLTAEILPLLTDALEEFADNKFEHGRHYLEQAMAKLSAV